MHDFFIDKYEVTNKQYKKFINEGGYESPKYWENKFIKDGNILSWQEAMKLFVDQTGRPGPATWQASDYPDGKADYPVSGISWYEAAAYARICWEKITHKNTLGIGNGKRNANYYLASTWRLCCLRAIQQFQS